MRYQTTKRFNWNMMQRPDAGTSEQWAIATGPWKQPEEFKPPPPKSNHEAAVRIDMRIN